MGASLDWVNLVVRWVHLTAGIAWIGSSFYFIWLDRHLTAPTSPRPRVDGEIWMVHSGGFYIVEKRRIGPGDIPAVLHWFKWEAMLTWASGLVLLAVVYYLTGGALLIDPAVSALNVGHAVLVALGTLVIGWFVYDLLWRSPLGRRSVFATVISLLLLAGATFMLFRLLSGRAAYIHVGSLLGTLMVANVWGVILPAQQQMIDATRRGQEPDFSLGEQAKRRSLHNSYMTLPVLFLMLSTHFPQTYGHRLGWFILLLLSIAGAAARHAMIGRGPRRMWALAPMTASFLVVVALATDRGAAAPLASGAAAVSFAEARRVINLRCLTCHSAFPTDDIFRVAPNGMTFDTPQEIQVAAPRIVERTAVQRTMPPGNKTEMTAAERALIRRWGERR
ncbi:MAG: urate hydroxylase PuuD [Gemmatimonadaceae bacterium]